MDDATASGSHHACGTMIPIAARPVKVKPTTVRTLSATPIDRTTGSSRPTPVISQLLLRLNGYLGSSVGAGVMYPRWISPCVARNNPSAIFNTM